MLSINQITINSSFFLSSPQQSFSSLVGYWSGFMRLIFFKKISSPATLEYVVSDFLNPKNVTSLDENLRAY
jgi:hypothetical protein